MSFITPVISRLVARMPGKPVSIYKTTSRSNNLETGKDTVVREVKQIPKATILPEKMQFVASQANVSSAKFGGFLPLLTTDIYIRGRDVSGFEINIEDCQVVVGSRVYEIVRVQDYGGEATILTVKVAVGVTLEEITAGTWSTLPGWANMAEWGTLL